MRRRNALAVAVGAGLAALLAWNSVYEVRQGWQAVVLRLDRPQAVITRPGLYAKLPFADRVRPLDRRDQALADGPQALVLADQSRLEVEPVMRFRIVDPLGFYRAAGAGHAGAEKLRVLLESALHPVLGAATLHDLADSGGRDALMRQVRVALARAAESQRLGITVTDVRLLRAGLSGADAQFVYRRMAAGEAQQAAQIRSQGEQRRRDIAAAADRDAALVRANAESQATLIRDQGEAARIAILAKAHAQDPALAALADTLAAYRSTLGEGNTTLVLTPGSGFLRDFAAPAAGK